MSPYVATRAAQGVRAPAPESLPEGQRSEPSAEPIYQTAVFDFPTIDASLAPLALEGGYAYSRYGLPNARSLELIAQTPGAQTREQALAHIAARERASAPKTSQHPVPSEEGLTKHEPTPLIDSPDDYAAGYFKRLKEKEKTPTKAKPKAQPKQPKGSKLTLVRKDGKPVPPDKQ